MNRKEFNSQISSDSVNRLKFLLGESELFQHFLKKTTGDKEEVSEKKSTKEKKRRTEKEEDEELLQQETEQELPSNTSKTAVITKFDESPSYIHNGVLREYQIEGLNWLISLYENGLSGILADVFIDSIYRFNYFIYRKWVWVKHYRQYHSLVI